MWNHMKTGHCNSIVKIADPADKDRTNERVVPLSGQDYQMCKRLAKGIFTGLVKGCEHLCKNYKA